jgi:hypothetical protein
VDGKRKAGYTTPTGPRVDEYQAGLEKNIYVIGGIGNEPENVTVGISAPGGKQKVVVRGAGAAKPFQLGKEELGVVVAYSGGGNDKIEMTSETEVQPGAVELDGGSGADELLGGPMEELLVDGIQQDSSTSIEHLNGRGGEDDLAQGEGPDKVEGGAGNDLFLNSRICEGDSFYAFNQGFEAHKQEAEAAAAEDNAQFHLLPQLGVYANMEAEKVDGIGKLGGIGTNKKEKFADDCGSHGGPETFDNFNSFEGSKQSDLVKGDKYHNYILGRGGENKLYGKGGADLLLANNGHPEWVINCGGQLGDIAQADKKWDEGYSPPNGVLQKTCKKVVAKPPLYDDNQPEGKEKGSSRKLHPVGGGGKAKAMTLPAVAPAAASPTHAATVAAAVEPGEELEGAFSTAEFHLDETSGTAATNALDGEDPGTYMAKGTGPSVGGPGPILGGEGALLAGEAVAEGSSISLDGKTAYVDLNGQGGPEGGEDGYSISLHVNFAEPAGKREYLFSSAGGGGRGVFLYRAANGSIVFSTGQVFGAPEVASEPVAAGDWNQVVASLKGETISLNVDGFPYELGYGSAVMPALESSPESLLGAGPGVTSLLDGSLDEFTSYLGVPSEGETLSMLSVSQAPLAAYLPVSPPGPDSDGDGVPDDVDNCPGTANPDQADSNMDGIGDACQVADRDEDGVPDSSDNCPTVYNPEQTDTNKDGLGNACSNLPPEVETGEAKEVKAATATLEGTVDAEGLATSYYFEYGPTTSYGTKVPATPKAIGSAFAQVAVSQALIGLTGGTTYHYRLVATNAAGTEAGADQTLTTLKAPKATTSAATAVGQTTASLNGSVNPEGLATSYYFEYGLTTSYGTKVPTIAKEVGAGTSAVVVSQALTGLTSATTYHFRAVATSVAAMTMGTDMTFTTGASTVSTALGAMHLTDPFNGTSNSVSNFSANWTALGWAASTPPKGEVRTNGWGPSEAYPAINGAFYGPTVTDVGTGVADVATLASGPGNNFPGRYTGLWLDLQTPGSTRGGYQLKFLQTSLNVYEMILAKWSAGTQTVLATKTGYAFAAGSSLALVDEGSSVSVWTNTGSGFTQLLTAADSTFSGGQGGVEGSGNESRLTNFKIGELLPAAANMSAALGALRLDDAFGTAELPLSESGTWAALSWDAATANRTGRVIAGEGWAPSDAFANGIDGAYWTKATFADTGPGDAVAVTLTKLFGGERHFELLLNMPTPATARSGYELRFTETTSGVHTVTLVKWASGTATTLATQAGFSPAIGGRVGLVDKAGVVSVWTASATGEFAQLLSASDATYQSGYVGVAAGGNLGRLANFRGAQLPPF